MGRANEFEHPMFYGTIGKNVTFFEVQANIGDLMAISLWKTNRNLILSHVGFTERTAEILNSERDLGKLYSYVRRTREISELNEFVYGYLASAFTVKVDKGMEYLYKLPVAISNVLCKSPLNGLVYPTMAMHGNAENIVLRPDFVDEGLELVCVEFVKIVKDGDSINMIVLDTASDFSRDGKINWSGRAFSWESNGKFKAGHAFGDIVVQDSKGNRILPKSTGPPLVVDSPTEERFNKSFDDCDLKIVQDILLTNNSFAKVSLCLSSIKHKRFLAFYVPQCPFPMSVALEMVKFHDQWLQIERPNKFEFENEKTGEKVISEDLLFSNEIIIFSEQKIHIEDLRRVFPTLNISLM